MGNKTVTVSGVIVIDGNSGGNYTVTYADNTASTISPAALTISSEHGRQILRRHRYGDLTRRCLTSGTLYTNVGTGVQDSLSGGTFAFTNRTRGRATRRSRSAESP